MELDDDADADLDADLDLDLDDDSGDDAAEDHATCEKIAIHKEADPSTPFFGDERQQGRMQAVFDFGARLRDGSLQLAEHSCLGYAYLQTPGVWRFTNKAGETASVRPAGPLRVNNGDAMMPALIAGLGLGVLPDFILREALADGRLERVLPDWSLPSSALHWVTPPGGPKPARIEVLGEFLSRKLSRADGAAKRNRDQRK